MTDNEIVQQVNQLIGEVGELALTVNAMIGSDVSRESNNTDQGTPSDLQRALEKGFSPDSLYMGPLRQWQYVLACHLAARPDHSRPYLSDEEHRQYADYVVYLVDQLISDQRFVGEMNLNWSKIWRTAGERNWLAARHAADLLRTNLSAHDRARQIYLALIGEANTRSPRD